MTHQPRSQHEHGLAAVSATVLVLVFAVACGTSSRTVTAASGPDGSGSSGGATGSGGSTSAPECTLNSNCASPSRPVCIFGTCSIRCAKDVDCNDPNLHCVAGPHGLACVSDAVTACGTGGTCKDGTTCIDDKCQVACTGDAGCTADETCSNGVCAPRAASQDAGGGSGGTGSGGTGGSARGTGTLLTVAGAVLTTTSGPVIHLRDHGFEYAARTCSTAAPIVCVTGALRP